MASTHTHTHKEEKIQTFFFFFFSWKFFFKKKKKKKPGLGVCHQEVRKIDNWGHFVFFWVMFHLSQPVGGSAGNLEGEEKYCSLLKIQTRLVWQEYQL